MNLVPDVWGEYHRHLHHSMTNTCSWLESIQGNVWNDESKPMSIMQGEKSIILRRWWVRMHCSNTNGSMTPVDKNSPCIFLWQSQSACLYLKIVPVCFLYHSVNSSSNNISRGTVGLTQGEKKALRTRIFEMDVARVFPKLGMTNGEKWFGGWISFPDQFYKISGGDLHSLIFSSWRLESWRLCSASRRAVLECRL